MAKKKTITKLKKEADRLYSIWLRKSSATKKGIVTCVTCNKKAFWKGEYMQCGHYESRKYLNIRYEPTNTHVQCRDCNVFQKGNYPEYALFMLKKYGKKKMEELALLKKKKAGYDRESYEYLITYLESKIELLVHIPDER